MAIKKGDKVKIHYTGKLANGKIFTTSKDSEPLECKVGEGKLMKGIEGALIGMDVSQKKEILIPPDKGFGPQKKELVKKMSKRILQGENMEIGRVIRLRDNDNHIFNAKLLAIETDTVTLDFNHPLAGETLNFDIEVIEIS